MRQRTRTRPWSRPRLTHKKSTTVVSSVVNHLYFVAIIQCQHFSIVIFTSDNNNNNISTSRCLKEILGFPKCFIAKVGHLASTKTTFSKLFDCSEHNGEKFTSGSPFFCITHMHKMQMHAHEDVDEAVQSPPVSFALFHMTDSGNKPRNAAVGKQRL